MMYSSDELQHYFNAARSSVLYRELYKGITDYNNAPFLQKAVLIQLLQDHCNLHTEQRGVYLVRSGGTTQNPLVFPVDIEENLEQRRILAAALVADKIILPTTIALNLFSYGLMYRTAAILDDIIEKCAATTLPLSAEAKNSDIYDAAQHFQPNLLMGSPSRLALFAQYIQENGQKLGVPNLLFGGEFLLPSSIVAFRENFGTEHIYALYGSAETGIWAWSHYSENPSVYRFIRGIHIEIAEPNAEGFGRIIVSNLLRKRFPVFRYDIGDIGRLVQHNGALCLELQSRVSHSFILDSAKLFVEDFKDVTSGADAFQIQLSQNDRQKHILRLLLVQRISPEHQQELIEQKTNLVKSFIHFSRQIADVSVEFVSMKDLYINKVTSKIPVVVDFRQ